MKNESELKLDRNGRRIIKERRANGSIRIRTVAYGKSLTDPSFAKEAEINHIVKQYVRTGELPHKNSGNLIYSGDIVMPRTMFEMNEFLNQAKESFAELPPQVRLKFDNKVENFADSLTKGTVWDKIVPEKRAGDSAESSAEPSKPQKNTSSKNKKQKAPSASSTQPDHTVQSEDE